MLDSLCIQGNGGDKTFEHFSGLGIVKMYSIKCRKKTKTWWIKLQVKLTDVNYKRTAVCSHYAPNCSTKWNYTSSKHIKSLFFIFLLHKSFFFHCIFFSCSIHFHFFFFTFFHSWFYFFILFFGLCLFLNSLWSDL